MEGQTLARIGAVVFVAVALTLGAIELTRTEVSINDATARQIENPNVDPLRRELVRCQRLGEAAPRDPTCLQAWAANRERFLKPGTKSVVPESDQPQNTTTLYEQMPNVVAPPLQGEGQ